MQSPLEQDILPEFDSRDIENKFKIFKETNQIFQDFVIKFQQNEKIISFKLKNHKFDNGLLSFVDSHNEIQDIVSINLLENY